MNFVGLDLAWGSLNPDKKPNRTGIAVLDASGYLTYVGTKVSDHEIRACVAPYVEGRCVVAIDAPLKVTNQTGRRLAEAQLRALASTPSRDAVDVGDSLSRVAEVLELAEQQLCVIRQQLI